MAEGTEVVFVDGVRTPFGRAGEKGMYWGTRADDLIVKAMIGLLERNPSLPKDRVDDVAIAATTQQGDQGLTLGRTSAILAGLPQTVPGYAIDRMCAGAMTSVTTTAGAIAFGAYDVAIAGGVEHMGRHPMGLDADPNPRFLAEKLVSADALNMGKTAERIHDRFPHLTKERADRYAMNSQHKLAAAYAAGKIQKDLIPIAVRSDQGWGLATQDEGMRPETTMEGLAGLKTPFRPHGRVTAGNSSPLTDGATVALMASSKAAKEFGLKPRMKLVSFAYAGVEPEVMGLGPIPSTDKALRKAGLTIDDIGLIELNEAFAVQVLALLDHWGVDDEDPRVNRWGGAIAVGHPLAASGVRIMSQLARHFEDYPEVRYGITALCIGLGQGGTVVWENPNWNGKKWNSGRLGKEAKELAARRKASK
ncbi:thiolase family protein [Naasia sp. SYSU D00948]|uniref:thiolase family protein n=1 Tax=Naasia sp. SYSU D00948 TaxID=2817379 RepID=UPI001B30A322|nr:thiolase family protein [Naasia sp. SYSU D00948]